MASLLKIASRILEKIPLYSSKPLSSRPDILDKLCSLIATLPDGHTAPDFGTARVARLKPFDKQNWLVFFGKPPRRGYPVVRLGNPQGNVLLIGPGAKPPKELRLEGHGNVAIIGEKVSWNQSRIRFISDNGLMLLGARSIINGTEFILEGDGRQILVGDHGLFAPGTVIRTSDLHAIVSTDSGHWINPPADVILAPRVWLGQDALILKGVQIGSDSVVGAKSLVTTPFGPNIVAGGVPARTIKTGIRWHLERQPPSQNG